VKALVCQRCGDAVLWSDPRREWWVYNDEFAVCPHHITDWALRRAGKRRTKATWAWVRDGRKACPRSTLGYATPFSIDN